MIRRNLGLGQIGNPLLGHLHPVLHWGVCFYRRGRLRKLLPQCSDLCHQRLILRLQSIQPVEHLFQLRGLLRVQQ
jgi:hypothetical protein